MIELQQDDFLSKFIEDRNAVSPEKPATHDNLREVTNTALHLLSPREQQIVRMLYGLNESGKEFTLQEVGEVFQLTRERIRQIEERALAKLRMRHPANKLGEYAEFVSDNKKWGGTTLNSTALSWKRVTLYQSVGGQYAHDDSNQNTGGKGQRSAQRRNFAKNDHGSA